MKFSVSCQYANHDHSESEELGSLSEPDVLKAFDDFDWMSQVAEADRLEKCSPTLSVEDKSTQRLIWVSAYSTGSSLSFVSECYFPGMTKKLFGLLERPGRIELDTQSFGIAQARKALELFMRNSESDLRALYGS